jgi:hypothetical protein
MYFLRRLARHAPTVMTGLCALFIPIIVLILVMSGTNVDLLGQLSASTSEPHTAPFHSPGETLTTVGPVLGNDPAAHQGSRIQTPTTVETPVHLTSAVTYCRPYCDGTGGDTSGGTSGGTSGDSRGGDHPPCHGYSCHPEPRPGGDSRGGDHPPCHGYSCHPEPRPSGDSRDGGPPRWQLGPSPVVQRPVVHPPVVQRRVVQPPVAPPPVVQPPVVHPPVEQLPVVPSPVVPPPVEPVTVRTAEPPVAPVVEAPVARQGFFRLIPGFWPIIVALIVLGVGLLAALIVLHALRNRHGQKWARARVQLLAGADPGVGVEVMESRMDHSSPTCVVRLRPQADSGTQIFEEVHR